MAAGPPVAPSAFDLRPALTLELDPIPGRDSYDRHFRGGILHDGFDDCFVIQPIGGLWAVIGSEIIVARCPTAPEAVRAAVRVAARTAGYGRRVLVLAEEPEGSHTVIWNSTRDSFSEA